MLVQRAPRYIGSIYYRLGKPLSPILRRDHADDETAINKRRSPKPNLRLQGP
jgi:hypothetical protein